MATLARTEAAIRAGMDQGLHVGAQLYATQGGTLVADIAMGRRDATSEMTSRTLVNWACASKPILAVATGQLHDRGRLHLDDPVGRHLSGFDADGAPVRVRHLLTHTAGFGADVPGALLRPWRATARAARDALVEPPGQSAGYTHLTAWAVLAELIEVASGHELVAGLRSAVFDVAEMDEVYLALPPEHEASVATMYSTERPQQPRSIPLFAAPYLRRNVFPGMSAWGSMRTLGRFYEALLAALRGGALLAPGTACELTATQRAGLHCDVYGSDFTWGLGLCTDRRAFGGEWASDHIFGHDGRNMTIAFADAERDLVVCLFTNGMARDMRAWRRRRQILGALAQDLEVT